MHCKPYYDGLTLIGEQPGRLFAVEHEYFPFRGDAATYPDFIVIDTPHYSVSIYSRLCVWPQTRQGYITCEAQPTIKEMRWSLMYVTVQCGEVYSIQVNSIHNIQQGSPPSLKPRASGVLVDATGYQLLMPSTRAWLNFFSIWFSEHWVLAHCVKTSKKAS